MTTIRVDPVGLRSSAATMGQMREDTQGMAADARSITAGAPSYDGQFGPEVWAIGSEASSRLHSIADVLADRTAYLQTKAADFEAADQAVVVGMGNITFPMFPAIVGPVGEFPIPDWLIEILLSMVPFWDAIDILKQLSNLVIGQDVDELVLIVATIGLLLDAGYLEPSPGEEVGNLGAGVLKTILKRVPKGPVRDELTTFLKGLVKDGDELLPFLSALGKLTLEHGKVFGELLDHSDTLVAVMKGGSKALEAVGRNEDFALGLLKQDGALKWALKNGPEAFEALAKSGDEGIALISRHGEPMAEYLLRNADTAAATARATTEALQAAERLGKVGLDSDEAADLIGQIARASTHGSGERLVLGKGGETSLYVQEALKNGGTYYETAPGFYDAIGRSTEIAWEVNERCIRNQLEAGIPRIDYVGEEVAYTLEHSVGTFRWREVSFLLDHADEYGYELIGNSWIKVR